MKFNVEKLKQMSRQMTDEEKKGIDFRRENRDWLAISERLALKLRRILRSEGISQNELAARMVVSPAQVTKILSGKENLGLKTISKIEKAIGQNLIEVATEEVQSVVEFENRTVVSSFKNGRYANNHQVGPIISRRSNSFSSVVSHNICS